MSPVGIRNFNEVDQMYNQWLLRRNIIGDDVNIISELTH